MKVTRIGLDIAKQIFELHGVDRHGRVAIRKTLRRERVLEYFSQLPACEVALEACGGAHYWHREISKLGHTVRLLPAHKVKPYLDGNKNNAHDAAAICEASSRPSMRWVEPKTIAQQDLQSLHRVRQVTVRQCTLLANHIRGLLLEYGIAVARGTAALQRALAQLLEPDEQRLSPLLKQLIAGQWRMLKLHEQQVKVHDRRIANIARHDASCQALLKVEGIGPLTATAGRYRRQRPAIQKRPPPQRLSGVGAGSQQYREQNCDAADHQARQPLPAHPAGPRRALHALSREEKDRPAQSLVTAAAGQTRSQRGGGGAGQQERAHRLGAAALWPSLSTEFGPRPGRRARRHTRSFSARPPGRPDTEAAPRERRQCRKPHFSVPPSKGEGRDGKMLLRKMARTVNFTPTSCERHLLQRI